MQKEKGGPLEQIYYTHHPLASLAVVCTKRPGQLTSGTEQHFHFSSPHKRSPTKCFHLDPDRPPTNHSARKGQDAEKPNIQAFWLGRYLEREPLIECDRPELSHAFANAEKREFTGNETKLPRCCVKLHGRYLPQVHGKEVASFVQGERSRREYNNRDAAG